MRRRQFLTGGLAGAMLLPALPESSSNIAAPPTHTPVTGPDHPLAPRKLLIFGMGATASNILRGSVDDLIGDYWMMWMRVPGTLPDDELRRLCTDLYPFNARNMSGLGLLARLGEPETNFLLPLATAWIQRLPVELLLLDPEEGAASDVRQLALRQASMLAHIPNRHRLGRTEAEAQHYLERRSALIFNEDAV